MISFARGAPSADLLPVEAVRAAAGTALDEDSTRALSYGTGIGHPGLCEWIGERHGGVDPGRVMVTNGSLEAGWMLFSTLLAPGDEVVVEQPSYDRTLLMLEKLGVDRIGVPLEADGIDVDGIEQALADGHRPKLVHIIPNFHNPAGCTLSEAKRRRLVELAAEHGFWIFEDDPYREVHFGGEPLPTMLALAEGTDAKVVHASSFSKTVSPGVRVGYLVGPADEIRGLAKGAGETYISPNMLAESIVFELCRSGALDATSRSSTRRSPTDATPSSSSSAGRSRRRSSSSPAAATSSGSISTRAPTPARCSPPPRRRASASSPAPTSCSKAARTASASPSPASPRTTCPRESPASHGRLAASR